MDTATETKPKSPAELQAEVDRLAPWPTSIYLRDGIWTRKGVNMAKTSWYVDQIEMLLGGFEGKRVLDIGSNTGYVALEAALRGAKEVVSTEPHAVNYDRCKLVYESRGLLGTQIKLTKRKMEDMTLEEDGAFDAIFFCGTVYHLEKPWEVLNQFGRMSETILVESRLAQYTKVNDVVDGLTYFAFVEHGADDKPLHRVDTGLIRHPTRVTLNQLIVRAGFHMTWQVMPTPRLTQKYQDEECIAFIGKRQTYKAPLVEKVHD